MLIYLDQDTRYHLLLFHPSQCQLYILADLLWQGFFWSVWKSQLWFILSQSGPKGSVPHISLSVGMPSVSPVSPQQREGDITEIKSVLLLLPYRGVLLSPSAQFKVLSSHCVVSIHWKGWNGHAWLPKGTMLALICYRAFKKHVKIRLLDAQLLFLLKS